METVGYRFWKINQQTVVKEEFSAALWLLGWCLPRHREEHQLAGSIKHEACDQRTGFLGAVLVLKPLWKLGSHPVVSLVGADSSYLQGEVALGLGHRRVPNIKEKRHPTPFLVFLGSWWFHILPYLPLGLPQSTSGIYHSGHVSVTACGGADTKQW